MFFGDLLTKKGDFELARVMYEYAKTSKNYASWKYKDVLEDRLSNIPTYHENFLKPMTEQEPRYHPVAEWSCVVCHEQ